MPWTKQQKGRDLPQSHYLRALMRLRQIDFEAKYPRLSLIFGGENFIKTKIGEISDALQHKNVDNVLTLNEDLKQAFSAISCFSQENGFHTDTPNNKMMRDFVKNSIADEHTMFRIIAHCLFILSIELHNLGNGKEIAN